MAILIQQKQIQQNFEFYRSPELPYLNGAEIAFNPNWRLFNPELDWYQAQVWAVCIQNQAGWQVGDRVLCHRGTAIAVTATEFIVRVRSNGINLVRKNGNKKEFNLSPNRWLIYIIALRRIG